MRICVAGRNSIAKQVCESIVRLYPDLPLYVIPSKKDCGEDGFEPSLKKYATENQLPIVSLEKVSGWEDLVLLSVEYDRIIDVDKFKSKRLFNIHLSLLPRYKGMYTSALPILNGDTETGVTLHLMDYGIDTGDILAQKTIPITAEETCDSLYHKLYKQGAALVVEYLGRILQGDYNAVPQSSEGATYYSKKAIDYANLHVDLNQTACSIDRQIRAFHFRAFQLPVVFGYSITHASITNERSNRPPGQLIADCGNVLKISTIDYNLLLYKDRFKELLTLSASGNLDALAAVEDIKYYATERDYQNNLDLVRAATINGHREIVDFLTRNGFNQ